MQVTKSQHLGFEEQHCVSTEWALWGLAERWSYSRKYEQRSAKLTGKKANLTAALTQAALNATRQLEGRKMVQLKLRACYPELWCVWFWGGGFAAFFFNPAQP